MRQNRLAFQAILFDLDGTLVDTAPDLGLALNLLRARHGLPPLPAAEIRPHASHGARGLLKIGFGLGSDHPEFEAYRSGFLNLYAENICHDSRLFEGIPELLDVLEARRIPWGVVTNKPARFTEPLLSLLNLADRAATIVSGDTCPQPKPHPDPMHYAADELGLAAAACLYVGDAERDVEAARAAGMESLVALWGYLAGHDRPQDWHALACIARPEEVLNFLAATSSIA